MSNSNPQPGTYVKDGNVVVAETPAKAVALAFEGYALKADKVTEAVEAPEAEVEVDEVSTETETAVVAAKPTPPANKKD